VNGGRWMSSITTSDVRNYVEINCGLTILTRSHDAGANLPHTPIFEERNTWRSAFRCSSQGTLQGQNRDSERQAVRIAG
jgi:hypothetical protein